MINNQFPNDETCVDRTYLCIRSLVILNRNLIRHSSFVIRHLPHALLVLLLTSSAFALTPDQILILVAKGSKESHQIAEHYMQARHIPADHFLEIPVNANPADANNFHTITVPLIRQFLTDKKLDQQITCLVTTYGLPLAIGPTIPTAADQDEITTLRHELIDALEELKTATSAYQGILPPVPATAPVTTKPAVASTTHARDPEIPPIPQLENRLQAAVNAATARIQSASGPDHDQALKEFVQLHQRVAGIAAISNLAHFTGAEPHAAAIQKQWDQLSQAVHDGDARYDALAQQRDQQENRRAMIELRRRFHGITGAVAELSQQISYLQGDQSESAFDNELMMLWVNGYSRSRWQANPMLITRWPYLQHHERIPRVMMVSRLDGLSVQQVNQMVDQSLKIEAAGLDGIAYFDARGLHQTDEYSQYDDDIRRAADYLRDNTDLKIVLDDTPQLLQAKNCPNAALYCGWYSVRNYQNSCQWLPGSVAYHIASFELISLHDPAETGWCSNLLRRGVCGTLGPTTEPYLFSFPKPTLFFPLLVCGLFTQAEVYYLTTPNTSWRIAYVGDPLYNPFKNKPRLSLEKLRAHPILRNALEEMGINPVTTGPTTVRDTNH